ncbi:MAG: HU family DNA-binding protein [Nitrospinota bacterium]|nr:HU family DNA-binding protein [Nitrospinota bacterium]
MTKAELIDRLSAKINLTKKDSERIVNIVLGSIVNSLAEGDKVELRGFGSFRSRQRKSRNGRNPRTGESVSVPPKNIPFFKAGKDLRKIVNEGYFPDDQSSLDFEEELKNFQ